MHNAQGPSRATGAVRSWWWRTSPTSPPSSRCVLTRLCEGVYVSSCVRSCIDQAVSPSHHPGPSNPPKLPSHPSHPIRRLRRTRRAAWGSSRGLTNSRTTSSRCVCVRARFACWLACHHPCNVGCCGFQPLLDGCCVKDSDGLGSVRLVGGDGWRLCTVMVFAVLTSWSPTSRLQHDDTPPPHRVSRAACGCPRPERRF